MNKPRAIGKTWKSENKRAFIWICCIGINELQLRAFSRSLGGRGMQEFARVGVWRGV